MIINQVDREMKIHINHLLNFPNLERMSLNTFLRQTKHLVPIFWERGREIRANVIRNQEF